MPNSLEIILALFGAYLLGSIPTAVWVGQIQKGIDIREHGSGNAGLTNAIRILGWKGARIVLIVDLLKGILAPLLMVWIGQQAVGDLSTVGAGLLAVLGHSFTCLAKFRGGKGVLTGLGVFLALAPIQAILAFSVWAIVVWRSRYVSLGSILACISLIILLWGSCLLNLSQFPMLQPNIWIASLGTFVSSFVIFKHRSNVVRLWHGTENKLGAKK